MSDLAYRLRKHAKNGGGGEICLEAADEIERLEAALTNQLEEPVQAEPVEAEPVEEPAEVEEQGILSFDASSAGDFYGEEPEGGPDEDGGGS